MAEPVRGLHIPEPCTADWERMHGDQKRRFCGSCSKHVHDLSAMSSDEARGVLAQGNVCVRFQQDADGNVVHHSPPRRASRLARTVALGAALLGAGPALAAPSVAPPSDEATTEREPTLMERVLARMRAMLGEEAQVVSVGQVRMGDVAPEPLPPPMMGAPIPVEPPPPPPPPVERMGRVALPPPPPAPPPVLIEPAPGETVIPEVEEALRSR